MPWGLECGHRLAGNVCHAALRSPRCQWNITRVRWCHRLILQRSSISALFNLTSLLSRRECQTWSITHLYAFAFTFCAYSIIPWAGQNQPFVRNAQLSVYIIIIIIITASTNCLDPWPSRDQGSHKGFAVKGLGFGSRDADGRRLIFHSKGSISFFFFCLGPHGVPGKG